MQQDNEHSGIEQEHGGDAEQPQSPTSQHEVSDGGKSDADKQQDREIQKIAKRSRWAIVLAIIAPVIAFGSCAAGFLQWKATDLQNDIMAQQSNMILAQLHVMREQLADARKSVADANVTTNRQLDIWSKLVDANKTMAGAARQHANTAKNTLTSMIESDRPTIGATGITSNMITIEPEKEFVVTFQLRNSGRRPADIYLSEFAMGLYPKFPRDPEANYRATTEPSRAEVVPGSEEQITMRITLAAKDVEQIRSKTLTLFAYGHVEYRDAATDVCRDYHVCAYYMPERAGLYGCNTYNYTTKKGCPKQQP